MLNAADLFPGAKTVPVLLAADRRQQIQPVRIAVAVVDAVVVLAADVAVAVVPRV